MFKNPKRVLLVLIILTAVIGALSLPENFRFRGFTINPPKTHLGLDLAGGTRLVLEADMKEVVRTDRMNALESVREVIERRVNFFGVSEPVVQSIKSGDNYRISVELSGVSNVDEATSLLGQTAKLEFREFLSESTASDTASLFPMLTNTKAVGITGKDLKKAGLTFSSQTGEPEVSIEFTSDGAKKFAEVTKRLVGKQLAIFLDDLPLTWPRVNTEITDGNAVITGSFTQKTGRSLAIQLNAGALPVPVTIIEKQTVGATMGAQSVTKSVRAGLIGLAFVAGFMIIRYGWLGVLADLALLLYSLISIALYRLIPITLTLPGIAGFILSIGMAVDSNILIFERYKEEVRRGKPWKIAMELGFGKAWDSIRDANITTIVTSIILFNPGNWQFLPVSGLVRGFAATLFLGVITSLFTGIVVTRTLIRVLYRPKGVKS